MLWQMIKIRKDPKFNPMAIMGVSLLVFVLNANKKNRKANLGSDKWRMVRLEISHGARTVDHLTKPCWLVKEKWTP